MPDITLNTLVKEAVQDKVIGAFTTLAGTRMELNARGRGDPENEFDGRWDFTIPEQQEGENLVAFSERFLRSLGIAAVKMVDIAEDTVRYRDAVAAVAPPESDVPDDVLT